MLYKYRSLEDFKNFVDIVLKQRLFAADYRDLNDPKEGQFLYSNVMSSSSMIESVSGIKQSIRIVSLSRSSNHPLMWAHYANGHRGVAIGVEIDESIHDLNPIQYTEETFELDHHHSGNSPKDIARNVLLQKHKVWKYEQEERILVHDGSQFVNVVVKEVIVGNRMSTKDYSLIKLLLNQINPAIVIKRADEIAM